MKIERIIIVFLVVLLVWFGTAIVRLENYRYASQVGLCGEFELPFEFIEKEECLNNTETRSSWALQLLSGLKNK